MVGSFKAFGQAFGGQSRVERQMGGRDRVLVGRRLEDLCVESDRVGPASGGRQVLCGLVRGTCSMFGWTLPSMQEYHRLES